jgi:spore maturation protein SpmA
MGSIFMNIASNMLGLDNAATPTGLKAMAGMQELNTRKDTATNPMIMFLVLNTSGLTIIPTTILAFRASYGAAQPTDVFIPILLATTWPRWRASSSRPPGSASTSSNLC